MIRPRYITKFFKAEDRKYFEQGSIKLGTLEEYRSIENANVLTARLDQLEGRQSTRLRSDPRHKAQKIMVPGIFDLNYESGMIDIEVEQELNDWVFCAMTGHYDPEKHKLILHGNQNYSGNAGLDSYCVFDLQKLVSAIAFLGKSHEFFRAESGEPTLLHRPVTYSKAVDDLLMEGQRYEISERDFHTRQYNGAVFTKPASFSPEHEYRIVFRFRAPYCAPTGAKPAFLKSILISNAIVSLGGPERI